MNVFVINYWQIAVTAVLLIAVAGCSIWLQLGLAKSIAIAAVRCVLQLALIGLVLGWMFANKNVFLLLLLLAIMTVVAAHAAYDRVKIKIPGLFWQSLTAIAIPSWLLLFGLIPLIIFNQSADADWLDARWMIPLLGVLLGNSLNGISLGLNMFHGEIREEKSVIENNLSMGATAWEASFELIKKSLAQALTPIINGMTVVGIVSLPGTMTGQLLAGIDPAETVRLQIFIMFVICTITFSGSLLAVMLAQRLYFTPNGQLRQEMFE